MSKDATAFVHNNIFTDFTNCLHKSHNNYLQSLFHPLELTFNSLHQASDLATQAMDQFLRTQTDAVNFFFDPAIVDKDDSATRQSRRVRTQRVAVVTGGIGGIGSEICKRLYNDGHDVLATYISHEAERAAQWQREREEEGYEIDIAECDVTSYDDCRKLSKSVERKYQRIDILVNCAGITRDSTLRKMQPEQWHAVLDTNLDSVFNVTRNFINAMVKRKYGRIVNISSVNGQKGQFGQTNYATAKAGIIGFSKALALEYADSGITVNTVCPGYVGTSMVEAIEENIKNSIIAKIPVGRLAKPAEIADVVAFLAADNSAYITGSEIAVNGGLFTGVA